MVILLYDDDGLPSSDETLNLKSKRLFIRQAVTNNGDSHGIITWRGTSVGKIGGCAGCGRSCLETHGG